MAHKTAYQPGLDALEARLAQDLEYLCYPPANWVEPRAGPDGKPMLDALVIGAGMCGLAAAHALLRHGVRNLRILDRAQEGHEGPWVTYARMETLRSPKHLSGPAAGVATLTFRAWFEAQHGASAWNELGKIPRTMWMAYLRWLRKVLHLPVENGVEVVRILPLCPESPNGGFEVDTNEGGTPSQLFARRIVIATGREGLARARIPPVFAPFMGELCWHSSDRIDFGLFEAKSLAVIGWAASAVDNAASAVEAGAAAVHVISRRPDVPRVNKAKSIVYAGFTDGFPALDDALKLELLRYIAACGVAAPRDSVLRLNARDGFELHLGRETQQVERTRTGLRLWFQNGSLDVHGVVLGTGFRIDVEGCAFLQPVQAHIARWADRLAPAAASKAGEFLDYPYLGPGFEFTERAAGQAPFLRNIFCFTHAASLNQGNVSSDIPSVSDGADRMAKAVVRSLFLADRATYVHRLRAYAEPELVGDELATTAWWPPL